MFKTITAAFSNKKSEAYVDSAMKILIAVVIGALLLALLWYIFNETVAPELDGAITDMFADADSAINAATGSTVYQPGAGA